MAGLFKRLFGGAANENTPAPGTPDEVYKGVEIFARPAKEQGQWRIGGTLKKEVAGAAVERRFLRADLLNDEASARAATIGKAHLIIDQGGDSLFAGEDRMV